MTIQMLTPYSLGRYTIPAGAVVGLFDAATEAGLIAAKQAIASAAAANWTVPMDNPQPASLTGAQVAATQALVSGGGIGPLVLSYTSKATGAVWTANTRSGWTVTGRQWTRDGVDIGGATSLTYTLQAADAGAVVGCRAAGALYTAFDTADALDVPLGQLYLGASALYLGSQALSLQ